MYWHVDWLNRDVDALDSCLPRWFLVAVDGGPELMALGSALFRDVASCDDQGDVLLSDHPPEILKCVFKGPLRCDDLSIADLAERSIDKVCVDVAIDDRISIRHAGAGNKDGPRVLVRFDVGVAILRMNFNFLSLFHAHILLHSSVRALVKELKFMVEVSLLPPLLDTHGSFKVFRMVTLDALQNLIGDILFGTWPTDNVGGTLRHRA